MPFYENQPTIYPLYRLLEEVIRGEIRVPRFQRPGTEVTWTPEQRGDLLDSIHRGFPIGTILLWSTKESIQTLEIVGGAHIPSPPDNQRSRLILDGHQRLSTLIAIFQEGLQGYRPAKAGERRERWVFDLSDDPQKGLFKSPRDRFVMRKDEQPIGGKQLPLSTVLHRVKLNKWLREHQTLSNAEIARADAVRDRFREYNLPVASLVTESLDEATESFHRINSSGTPMGPFHMVTALAYTKGFDPQEAFTDIRTELLEPEGWSGIAEIDMLRVCAGLVRRRLNNPSQHPAKLDIRGLAKAIQEHHELIDRTGEALAETAKLLRGVGIHGPGILPYGWQMIALAIEVGSRDTVEFTEGDRPALERWFWLTTYGEVFAGVNSAVVDRASRALTDLLSGGSWHAMARDTTQQIAEPSRSNFRTARLRGLFLQMARHQDKGDTSGAAHHALAQGASSLGTLISKTGRSAWYNLVIEPEISQLKQLRSALRERAKRRSGSDEDAALLQSIAIEPTDQGSLDALLQQRRIRLLEHERVFVEDLGLVWDTPRR